MGDGLVVFGRLELFEIGQQVGAQRGVLVRRTRGRATVQPQQPPLVELDELVQRQFFDLGVMLGPVQQHLLRAELLGGGQILLQRDRRRRADHARDRLDVQRRQHLMRGDELGHLDPGAPVRGLGQIREADQILGGASPIEMERLFLDEGGHARVQTPCRGPQQPVLDRRHELVEVETRHQRRIQVGELIFLAVVDRGHHPTAWRDCCWVLKRMRR